MNRDGDVIEYEPTEPTEVLSLADALDELRKARAELRTPPAGRLLGLPELEDDVWVDIAGAAHLAGVQPKTITAWLTRGGPARDHFPAPRRVLYRLYWPAREVEAWAGRRENRDPEGRPIFEASR